MPSIAYLLACGGGSDAGSPPRQQPAEDQGQAKSGHVPEADLGAFYGIATGSGTLRRGVAAAALGNTGRPYDTAELKAVRRRLAPLRPKDPTLTAMRAKLRAALTAAIHLPQGRSGLQQVARKALRATDAVNAGLQSYAARHPSTAALIPD
jgi:hypothetical protein